MFSFRFFLWRSWSSNAFFSRSKCGWIFATFTSFAFRFDWNPPIWFSMRSRAFASFFESKSSICRWSSRNSFSNILSCSTVFLISSSSSLVCFFILSLSDSFFATLSLIGLTLFFRSRSSLFFLEIVSFKCFLRSDSFRIPANFSSLSLAIFSASVAFCEADDIWLFIFVISLLRRLIFSRYSSFFSVFSARSRSTVFRSRPLYTLSLIDSVLLLFIACDLLLLMRSTAPCHILQDSIRPRSPSTSDRISS
mmetsp:Transcript_21521/g.53178  ORF Transcript_21521/g.53178 Transcript_21521/m.53178 type:complete len:251 (-) Transcript_21521:2613-3365(-)